MNNSDNLYAKTNDIYDVIIVGGGPAGYTAALYCARAGLSTIILEKMGVGGQLSSTDWVENYPGFEEGIEGFQLAQKMKIGAEKFGVVSKFGDVKSFELEGKIKKVHTSKETYKGKTVMLATGASPRKLGLDNEDKLTGRGIGYCAVCDGNFFRGKDVAVVGGGNSAAASAIYLSSICNRVYLIHRRENLQAEKNYLDTIAKTENIRLIFNSQIKEINGQDRLESLLIDTQNDEGEKKEENLEVSGLFVSVGRIPNTEVLKGIVKLDKEGYIAAGEDTMTSIDGVFAIGDVRTKPLRQIITAAGDGAVASKYASEYIRKAENQ